MITTHARSEFGITHWEEEPHDKQDEGPELTRATVHKTYVGDVDGESVAELLTCKVDPDDYTKGAGDLASERITGQVEERQGTFVIHHGGLSGSARDEETFGHVVPGSGTDDLTGIRGTVEINRSDAGEHTITLEYRFDAVP